MSGDTPRIRRAIPRFAWGLVLLVVAIAALGLDRAQAGTDGSGTKPQHEWVVTWEASGDGVALASDPLTQRQLEYVSIQDGCRFYDTRQFGGSFAAGTSRDLSVTGGYLPGPGCGIPPSALAVDLSLSTIGGSPSGPGWVRVGPGGVEPKATVLQFLRLQGTSVTTTASLDQFGQIRIKVFGASTGIVGDVLGYWHAPMAASVEANGTLIAGRAVLRIEKDTLFAGDYLVVFDRDVSNCSFSATPWGDDSIHLLVVHSGPSILVDARQSGSTAEADGAFQLVGSC